MTTDIVIVNKQQRLIVDPPSRTIAIMSVGPAGPSGTTGPQGPPGPGGAINAGLFRNGAFDIWQRGGGPFTTQGYCVDQWFANLGGSTFSLTRQPFALGNAIPGYEPQFFLRNVVTSSVGPASFILMSHNIEGVRSYAGRQIVISFWAKADAAKNISLELTQGFGSGGTPSAGVSIPTGKVLLSTTWQRYSVAVTIPSIAGKTLGTDGRDSLGFHIWLDAGSNYNARSSNLGQQSGTFDFWGFQVEEGLVPTAFIHPLPHDELRRCQRYYQRWEPGAVGRPFGVGQASTTTMAVFVLPFIVPMRIKSPTAFTTSGVAAHFLCWNAGTSGITCTAVPVSGTAYELAAQITFTVASGLVAGNAAGCLANNAAAWMAFSAEL